MREGFSLALSSLAVVETNGRETEGGKRCLEARSLGETTWISCNQTHTYPGTIQARMIFDRGTARHLDILFSDGSCFKSNVPDYQGF